jgi:glycine hydroxymethyltransferase
MLDVTQSDPEIAKILDCELSRQQDYIELIASENFVSKAVMQAQGSVLTNKYAEGYPGKRYYCGCRYVDEVEILAIERLKKLFECSYANVQPHSGSGANQAVFLALLQPGDTILSMSLDSGGHLTHGASPNLSGKWFNIVHYGVKNHDHLINYDQIEELALVHRPKLIIAGYSAYTRNLDFAAFRKIADKVGSYFMADIAHIAGLVAAKLHPSPLPYAHAVTTTTHKTLRGPRGGAIISNDLSLSKRLDSAIFPGLQGGPLMHVIAAKAVAFGECLTDDYRFYIKQLMLNAKALSSALSDSGYNILTGGTDNHMVIVDLRNKGITGKDASESLDRAGITCNKNAVPFDLTSPFITSGIRLGTPACTTRGFKEREFAITARMIDKVLRALGTSESAFIQSIEQEVREESLRLLKDFPIYL